MVAAIGGVAVSLLVALGGGVAWLVRVMWRVLELSRTAAHELQPNSGSSVADRIARTEGKIDALADLVAELTEEVRQEHDLRVAADGRIRAELDGRADHADREHRSLRAMIQQALDTAGDI